MQTLIFDIEGNSLTPDHIYCLSYINLDDRIIKTETTYLGMKNILANADILIGHNITRFDIPVLERLLGIDIKAKLVDTLGLSWYLEPKRQRHGLKWWGEDLGVAKVVIDDWENLPLEDYIERCEEDVRINTLLWDTFWQRLLTLYDGDAEECWRLIDYLQFKMDCAREQENSGWKLDVDMCWANMKSMNEDYAVVFEELKSQMPSVPVMRVVKPPASPFKKNGDLSVIGKKWFDLLETMMFPKDYKGSISFRIDEKEPNPGSSQQVKEWLFSLGWVPTSFKYVKDKNNYRAAPRKIPQIRIEGNEGKELCPSVLKLIDKEPAIGSLDGITVLAHRISILKSFLSSVDGKGYVQAQIQGFTNTLRFKHKTVVNLPGVDKPYGDIVRGCLMAPDGYELMGSDMVGLEDTTKHHYMYKYDPDYVEEMNTPGFDPHLDIAMLAKMMTLEEVDTYKGGDHSQKPIRHKAKTTNYACVYGIQADSLSRDLNIPKPEAQELIDTYWERNWAVIKIAEDLTVKTIDRQKWLFNPVSKFWYSLRHEKDRFSTLNQGTGTYVFDCWVKEIRETRPQMTGQFHDEVVCCIRKGNRNRAEGLLQDAIGVVNKTLNLNKDMAVEVQFGETYAEIH